MYINFYIHEGEKISEQKINTKEDCKRLLDTYEEKFWNNTKCFDCYDNSVDNASNN